MGEKTEAEIELQLKRDRKSTQRELNKRHGGRFRWAGSSSDDSVASSWSGNKSFLKEGYRFPTLRYRVSEHLSNITPNYREPQPPDLNSNFVASSRYRNRYSRRKKNGKKGGKVPTPNKETFCMKENTWKKYLTNLEDERKPAAKPSSRVSKKRKVSLCPSLNQERKCENLEKSTSEEEF